jgi:poly(beta-D-mannuronate) lyase
MAVAAAGVAAGDAALLGWGMGKGAVFLDAVTSEGAHPQEILRGRMALHYHLFALQSAAALARLGEAGGQPFDPARADALARFARFTYAATQDTARIDALAGVAQGHLAEARPWLRDGQGFEIIRPRVAPPEALAPFRPYRSSWLGGNVTLLWGH